MPDFIGQIHAEKSILVKIHAEWKTLGGPEADTAVGAAVENLSQSANRIINGIRAKMAKVRPGGETRGGQ